MEILDGNNISTSLLLLLGGLLLFASAPAGTSPFADHITLIVSLALIGFAVISSIFFFPVPAVLTGSAAALGFAALVALLAASLFAAAPALQGV